MLKQMMEGGHWAIILECNSQYYNNMYLQFMESKCTFKYLSKVPL